MKSDFLTILIFLGFILGLIFGNFNIPVLAQTCPSQTQYSSNYAVLSAEIIDTGGENNVQAWFEWGLNSFLGNSTPQQNFYIVSTPYRYCYTLANLNPCTTYYYRSAVRNSQGIGYGQIYSFTTRCQTQQNPLNVSCYALPNPAPVGSLVSFYSVVSGGTGYYSYEWTGACTGSASTCQKTFTNPGNYLTTLRVTSGNETRYSTCSVNVSQDVSLSISQNQSPVAVIAFSPEEILPGTVVTFNASNSYDPDGYITSYAWYVNNQLVSNDISFSRALASGNHRIKLTVTDNRGSTNTKEILISVGRNVYLTRTVTKTITKTVPTDSQVKFISSRNLIDILLDSSYRMKTCSSQDIRFTLVNNTSVNRQINILINGEIKDWFATQEQSFILSPRSTQFVNWKVNVPCKTSPGIYEFTLKISTPGEKFEKRGVLEIESITNPFNALLSFIRGVPILGSILANIWFFFILFIVILAYMFYRFLRKKISEI